MLPRIMISPIVSPSRGHRLHRRRVEHRHALLQRVAHALAAVAGAARSPIGSAVPFVVLGADRGRPVDLGQAVDMRHVEADALHALDHRGRRRGAGGHHR